MSASFARRTSLRFPGHPAPAARQARPLPQGDTARPRRQAANGPAAGVGKDLFAEVISNIQSIIRGDRPVRAAL